ncbi:MAG: DUF1653 domain-containing protein [Oscillospiraceae bacterium]|nr:DUF1653 domain-containing protein [Oscillospiraceae bacterium]
MFEVRSNPEPGEQYRHFKGFVATIITIATHTETGEKLVVYRCVDTSENSNHEDGIYARPLEMFMSKVDREAYPNAKQEFRFEKIF